jgi:hypothetical protein
MASGDIKVEDHPELVRRGAAIVNTDRNAFIEYVSRRQKAAEQQQEVANLKQEVADLKGMLSELLEKMK